jgi:hypothetical protein
MSWLSTLFNGNSTVNNASSSLLNTGASTTGAGMADTSAASSFFNSILSGNMKSLAPQVGAITKQGQQQKQTLSQFGNRSGGTNAQAQSIGDTTTANINSLFQGASTSAANSLGSLGTNLLGIGTNATDAGASLSLQNKSLFSQLLSQFANGAGKGVGAAAAGG